MHRSTKATLLGGLLAALPTPGFAASSDPDNDFLPSYTGPPNQELDHRSIDVRVEGAAFRLSATVDAPIGVASTSYFAWGISRSGGIAGRIPSDLLFDTVFITYANGAVEYTLRPPPAFTPLPGIVTIMGDTISALLPLALPPENGFTPQQHQFTVWTHYAPLGGPGVPPGGVPEPGPGEIADFSAMVTAAVPEPATWAMMIGSLGLIGGALLRRRIGVSRGYKTSERLAMA